MSEFQRDTFLTNYTPLYTCGASSSQGSILVASIKRSDIIVDIRTDIRTMRLSCSKQNLEMAFFHEKRSFVYSAVTLFDTTNTSIDTAPLGGAGSGVFGLVSFARGGPRFESLGVSLLFSGRGPASSNNMVASNVTRWLRSETRVWIGNKQA
jgi:hypothetical protein